MKPFFFFMLINATVFFSLTVSAQTATDASLKSIYEKETIYLYGGAGVYVKNGQHKKTGLWGKQLSSEFVNCSPEAKEEMGMFVKRQKRAMLCALSAMALLGGTLTVLAIAPAAAITPVVATGLGGALTLDVLAIPGSIKAQQNLHKAVWLHNRDVLTK